YVLLHETNPWRGKHTSAQSLIKGYGQLIRIPAFWGFALTAGFSSSAFFSFVGGAAYVVITLMKRTPIEYGLYFAFVSLGYIIGNFVAARYVVKFGPQRMIRLGAMLSFVSVLITAALYALNNMQPLLLFLPTMILGIGNGLLMPSCIAGAVSVKPEIA